LLLSRPGFVSVQYALIPGLWLLGRGPAAQGRIRFGIFALGLIGSFVLLALASIRLRSFAVAMASALTVGVLVIWGLSAPPGSPPRLLLLGAAILCLAALCIQMIKGVVDRRLRALWVLPFLVLGFPIGFFGGGAIGLHIVS
jgi:hypothetical protein